MSSASYKRLFAVLALAFLLIGAIQIVAGSYSSGVVTLVLGGVLILRVAGVIPTSGLRLVKDGLGTCPRCGARKLAPDVDKTGVRHCWNCGADVTAAGVTEGL
jgi:hypothetical protein